MIDLPNYSFSIEFEEITSPDLKLEFYFDKKKYTEEDYRLLVNNLIDIFLVWTEVSFHGGFNERISKMHPQGYYNHKIKKHIKSIYLEKDQLKALINLFNLIEKSYNTNPDYEMALKVSKIKISSLPFDFFDLDAYMRGRLSFVNFKQPQNNTDNL